MAPTPRQTPAPTSAMPTVAAAELRAFLLEQLGLRGPYWKPGQTASKLRDLAMVQIDSIRVTGLRNHELAFVARTDAPADRFYDLLYKKRLFLETHYPVFAVRRDWAPLLLTGFATRTQRQIADRKKLKPVMAQVLDHISRHGPTSPADLQSQRVPGGFNTIKATTRAMDLLFTDRVLQIAGRSAQFHRLFDLTERHMPELVDWRPPEPDAYERFLIHSALTVLKLASADQVAERAYIHFGQWRGVSIRVMRDMAQRWLPQIAVAVQAGDLPGQPVYWHLPDDAPAWRRLATQDAETVRIVPPLDNFLFNRRRLKELFDFNYKFEAYTPAAQRRFYFAMPLIYQDRVAGLIDVVRRDGAWHIVGLDQYFPVPPDRLRAAVHRLAWRAGADRVKVTAAIGRDLKRALAGERVA